MSLNAAVTFAITSLLIVLAGRVVLLSSAPAALQAQALLPLPAPSRAETARLVLVTDRDDDGTLARVSSQLRESDPSRPVEAVRVPWPVAWRHRSREAGVARLVRTYGYSELPVLLTVSRDGQVVRVQSLPAKP